MEQTDSPRKEPRSRRRGQHQHQNRNHGEQSPRHPPSTSSRSNATPPEEEKDSNLPSGSSSVNSRQHEARRDISRLLANAGASTATYANKATIRYTIEQLLVLKESPLVKPPTDFSPFTPPPRPDRQAKPTDQAAGARQNGSAGQDSNARRQKDIVLAPQRPLDPSYRGQNSTQRVFGVPRSSVSNGSIASNGNSNGMPPDGGLSADVRVGSSLRNLAHFWLAARQGTQSLGRRASNNDSSSRSGAASWRSSAGVGGPGGGRSNYHQHQSHQPHAGDFSSMVETERGQPEWMDDDMAYDENQSMTKINDIEEWKQRMKRQSCEPTQGSGYTHDQPHLVPTGAVHSDGAARGSRFLRLFQHSQEDDAVAGQAMQAATQPTDSNAADVSKLFKVLGSKVSVAGHSPSSSQPPPPIPAEAGLLGRLGLAGYAANPAALAAEKPAITLAQHVQVNAAVHKSASPAPINEALRGIVPTSVFRKSIQSGGSPAAAKRPDSASSSSRSATPARNLPSWLVELSRGRPAAGATDGNGAPLITNDTLGTHDLIDALEREFPALSVKPRPLDNQSISSLSVQASVGVPGDIGSIRRGSVDTVATDRQTDAVLIANDAITAAVSGTCSSCSSPSFPAAASSTSPSTADTSVGTRVVECRRQPAYNAAAPANAVPSEPGCSAHVAQQCQQCEWQYDDTRAGAKPQCTNAATEHCGPKGQMPPPHMPMMPPPPHGFPAGMMYGMAPPPHGMFGNMPPPPMSFPMGQMNGIPAPMNEHQQLMLMKMMAEVPPQMMFGQMPPLPQQHMSAHGPSPAPGMMQSSGAPYPGILGMAQAADGHNSAGAQDPLHPSQQHQQ
ncbi:hypothetical protein DL89DRAFT_265075 [Linderina pennispora]|uniref:Uncharacterized protein n=1 Tax=Linderina pennispora TaxID=61395 RepID=A0A1Y1WH56_9FUNG|nr:uncharacterized protein DL89DRAFT_265075 [Linderina pennispora]ORX72900.1 hypothetical protein DL89DRAFT_265075 [Linderina pennispora]